MSADTGNPLRDQALALAGVAQFAMYAHELATEGRDLPARFEAARHAIFCTDPGVVMDVYGEAGNISDGKRYLRLQLSGRRPDDAAARVARYMGQILKLSGNLKKDEAALNRIGGAIERARLTETRHIASILDETYRNNVSPLKPRIMLHGNPDHLRNDLIQARVRTQLLAGVRCGILWRQCGGGFLSLFFRRKALLEALDKR